MRQAYGNMKKVCQDNKVDNILNELITDNLMSYVSHQNLCVYNEIDDKVHDLKQQIFERRILGSPKFESLQGMGVTDKEWNLIKAAAEKTKNTGIHKKLEQDEQNDTKLKLHEETTNSPPGASEVQVSLQQRHYKKHPYSHLLFSCDECNLPFIEENDWRYHLMEEHLMGTGKQEN